MADISINTKDSRRGDHRDGYRGGPRGAPRGGQRGGYRGGNRGRGFGRGGKRFNDQRNEERKENQNRRDNREGHERRENKKRRGHAPKDAPKDSFFYKFHFGPWPEIKEVEVTLTTELPEQIPKENRLQEPTKEEYIKGMEALDDEIKELIEKIKQIRSEKDEIFTRGVEESKAKAAAEGVTKYEGKSFKELVEEKRALMNENNQYMEKINKARAIIDSVTNEVKAIQKNIDPKYKTVKAVNERIKDVDTTIQTSTISSKQEKDYYKEIAFLKKSIKYVEKLEKIRDTKKLREEVKANNKESKALREKIAKYNNILDIMNEEFKERKKISGEKKEELQKLDAKMDSIREEIKAVEVRKDEAREDYYKRKYEYECQKEQIYALDRQHRRKKDLLKFEEEKKKKEEEKKAERDSMPNPFEDDISTCDFLIRFCKKIIKDREQKETKVIKDTETKEELAKKAEEFKKQAEEGKIMFIKSKEEREKEDVLVIGGKSKGKKKKRGKKKAQPKVEEAREARDPNELNFKYEVIQHFGEINVEHPSQFQELEAKIEELEAKRNEFFEKGEQKLDETLFKRGGDETQESNEEEVTKNEKKKAFNLEEEDDSNWPVMQ